MYNFLGHRPLADGGEAQNNLRINWVAVESSEGVFVQAIADKTMINDYEWTRVLQ